MSWLRPSNTRHGRRDLTSLPPTTPADHSPRTPVQPPQRRVGGRHLTDRRARRPPGRMEGAGDTSPGSVRRLRPALWWAALGAIVIAVAATVIGVGRLVPDNTGRPSVTADYDHDVVLQVRPGDTAADLGERLAAMGVVDTAQSFASAARSRTPPIESVEPGFYVVSPGGQPEAVVAQLTDPASRVGVITVEAGQQLDDVADPATGVVRPGLLSQIAQATCLPDGRIRRCLSAEELRLSAAQSDTTALGIPDWARDPVAAMTGDHRRVEGLIGIGRWNVDPTATPAQILSTLISGSAVRYDQNSLLRAAAREHGVSALSLIHI